MESVLPYYIFLGITMLIFAQHKDYRSNEWSVPVMLTLIMMILFAGFRNQSVGTDTMAYVRAFSRIEIAQLESGTEELILSEPGYYFLQKCARVLSDNYWALLCTIAAVCYILVMRTILKFSDNQLLSLFIYITLGYYTFCFNAARQAVALSIYLLAYPCIMNRQPIKYIFIVCVAALFHKSVLIAIPLYFIFRLKYTWKSVLIVVVASLLVARYLPMMLESAKDVDERYSLYADVRAVGGYMLTLFYTLLTLFCIFMRRTLHKMDLPTYDIFLQMLICGSVIYLVVSLTESYVELTRFAAYFQISTIFLLAKLFKSRGKTKNLSILMMFICGCLGFYYIFLTTIGALVPYKLNSII